MRPGVGLFPGLCLAVGVPAPTPEYRFAPPRRWRFDWALIDQRIALEVQGGLFMPGGGGRHSRGAALRKEHEKMNAAAALGWVILYVMPEKLLSDGPDLFGRVLTGRRL